LAVLAPGCVVTFEDYPIGDLDGDEGAAGKSGGAAGNNSAGTGNDNAPPTAGGGNGGSGATSGTDSGGNPSGAGSSGSASGGSDPVAGSGGTGAAAGSGGSAGSVLVDLAGMGGEGGSPMAEPLTIVIPILDDTYLSSNSKSSNYGNEQTLIIDRNTGGAEGVTTHDALLRASLDNALPSDAQVSAATLTLSCSRIGDPINVSYIESAWQELTVRWYNSPMVGTLLASVAPNAAGVLSIDLKPAVIAWLSGAHANYGVYLSLPGLTASECASSDALDEATRPKLSVTYTLP